jgi:hypothetical protein
MGICQEGKGGKEEKDGKGEKTRNSKLISS